MTEEITILTEGSAELGYGHIRRSITLAKLLQDHIGVKLWVVSNDCDMGSDIIERFTELDVAFGPFPKSLSRVQIMDLEPSTVRSHFRTGQFTSKRLCLDWFDPSWLPDVTMNLLDHSGMMKSAYRTIGRPTDYIEGPRCAIIRNEFRALRPSMPLPVADVRHVVITTGGADPARRTLAALDDLAKKNLLSLQLTVVVGPLFTTAYEEEIRAASPAGCRIMRAPPDYESIISSADLVICSGGGTLLESMCLAKPTVVYPQTKAEEDHALYHAQAGACSMANSLGQVLHSAALRNSLASNAHRRVDGRGAERIAETALELFHRN